MTDGTEDREAQEDTCRRRIGTEDREDREDREDDCPRLTEDREDPEDTCPRPRRAKRE